MDTLERNTYYKTSRLFQKMEAEQREQAALQALFERKHFLDIMHLMYREKMMRQKDIVEALGISKGIVCLNMNEMDAAGLIQQRKEGRCKTYRLLRKGAEYYEANYLKETAPPRDRIAMPEQSHETVRRLLGEEPDAAPLQDALANILTRMDAALEKLTTTENEQLWMESARETLPEAEELASAFQTIAERSDMLLYYYMGEYQAKLSWLKEALHEPRPTTAQKTAVRGRHFDTILRLLYEEKTIPKQDMVKRLGISTSNTFVHVKAMVEAGFIEEDRDGVCRIYRLSPEGERYYEEHAQSVPNENRKAAPTETKPERRIRPKSAKKPLTVLNEKNFTNIMQILYKRGELPLSDLCSRLERPHGNVYRDMKNLTLEGFVKKETIRHCNYYTLSAKGVEYCEARFEE